MTLRHGRVIAGSTSLWIRMVGPLVGWIVRPFPALLSELLWQNERQRVHPNSENLRCPCVSAAVQGAVRRP
jgi:hypothetical protein